MNCREFESVVVEIARAGSLDAATDREGMAHAKSCSRCALRLKNERRLTGAVTALTGARVIDGTGRAPLENATLVVANGKIQEVGTAVKVPAASIVSRIKRRLSIARACISGGLLGRGRMGSTSAMAYYSIDPDFRQVLYIVKYTAL